jgi:hypothetical protein
MISTEQQSPYNRVVLWAQIVRCRHCEKRCLISQNRFHWAWGRMRYFGQRENERDSVMCGRERERELQSSQALRPLLAPPWTPNLLRALQRTLSSTLGTESLWWGTTMQSQRSSSCVRPELYNGRCMCHEDSPLCLHFLHLTLSERSTVCMCGLSVQWPVNTPVTSLHGRGIAQAVRRRLPTEAAQARSQVKSCWICGGQVDIGAGFLWLLRFPLPMIIPPKCPILVYHPGLAQ